MGLNEAQILERIIEQAYAAYYGFNHQQAWSNYRRTGYPAITSTANSPNENNPSNSVPVRFLYPTSEFEYNAVNVETAISNQGGALLDNPLWIFE